MTSIQNSNNYDALKILANQWPEGAALTEKLEFVPPPVFLEHVLSWVTCDGFNTYCPEYRTAVHNIPKTQMAVTKIIFETLNEIDLCKQAAHNFNSFISSWPKKKEYTINVDAIIKCAHSNEIQQAKTSDDKIKLLFKLLPETT